jgi:hypothetical protein
MKGESSWVVGMQLEIRTVDCGGRPGKAELLGTWRGQEWYPDKGSVLGLTRPSGEPK